MRRFIVNCRQSDQYCQRRNGHYRADQMADGIEILIAVWRGDQRIENRFLHVHVREYILYLARASVRQIRVVCVQIFGFRK